MTGRRYRSTQSRICPTCKSRIHVGDCIVKTATWSYPWEPSP